MAEEILAHVIIMIRSRNINYNFTKYKSRPVHESMLVYQCMHAIDESYVLSTNRGSFSICQITRKYPPVDKSIQQKGWRQHYYVQKLNVDILHSWSRTFSLIKGLDHGWELNLFPQFWPQCILHINFRPHFTNSRV